MANNALKSIDPTNCLNVLICFFVSCLNRGGQVSPARTMSSGLFFVVAMYRGADKSSARIDNSYMKIKHISCLSSL